MYFHYEYKDDISVLSVESARLMAANKRDISLNGLTTLTVESATAIARHEAALSLNGLAEMSKEVAEALANHKGGLELNGMTDETLTLEIARALSRHVGFLSLNGLSDITDAVAQLLGEHCGTLVVDGLKTLTNERLAKKLLRQKHRSPVWHSNPVAIKLLSAPAARLLAERHESLELCDLPALNADTAQALASHSGYLCLDGVTELTLGAACQLARFRGEKLSLNGVKHMGKNAAQALSRYRGSLSLDGLEFIFEEDAIAFGQMQRRDEEDDWSEYELSLCGLKKLSIKQAVGLAAYEGRLNLDGVEEISPEAARILTHGYGAVRLRGLRHISNELAQAFAECNAVELCENVQASKQARTMLECNNDVTFVQHP